MHILENLDADPQNNKRQIIRWLTGYDGRPGYGAPESLSKQYDTTDSNTQGTFREGLLAVAEETPEYITEITGKTMLSEFQDNLSTLLDYMNASDPEHDLRPSFGPLFKKLNLLAS